MAKEFNLNFHQTFPPESSYLSRLFDIVGYNYSMSKEEISELTGIPTGKSSGKVEPMIKYAQYMGLITDEISEGKHNLSLTPLGEIVLAEDMGFQEELTLWLCHARLCSVNGAPLWYEMIKHVLPKYNYDVKNIYIQDELERVFQNKREIHIAPFYSSYANMFKRLKIVEKSEETTTLKNNFLKNEFLYLYAYTVLYEWEALYVDEHNTVLNEITGDEFESMMLPQTLGLSETDFEKMLRLLEEHNIIKFNRQLVPYTVIKLANSKEILPLLYSLLN